MKGRIRHCSGSLYENPLWCSIQDFNGSIQFIYKELNLSDAIKF
jgi:hypothetical protein